MEQHPFGQIGLSHEQVDLLEVATNFCRDKSPMEKVRQLMEDDRGFDQDIWREIVALGWLGIAIPENYEGGAGLGVGEIVPVIEQMGRAMMATPFIPTSLAAQILLIAGSEAQKQKYLPELCGGKIFSCAFMETEGAWDLSNIKAGAEATNNRDGAPVSLSGKKTLVSDADSADYLIVSVMCDQRPSIILLNREQFKDRLTRETLIDETKRSCSLDLNDIECDKAQFLDTDKVAAALSHYSIVATLLSAAECCGGAKSVIDYTLDYLKTRKQFGKLIGSYQALKHPTVDAYVSYEQSRSLLYSAAHSFNDQGSGEIATRMAMVQCHKTLTSASDRAIQFHGGFGFTYDCDAQLYRRRAIWHGAVFGDGAFHKSKLGELLF